MGQELGWSSRDEITVVELRQVSGKGEIWIDQRVI